MRTRLGDRVLPIDEPIAEAWALLGIPNPLPLTMDCWRRLPCMSDGCDPQRRGHLPNRRVGSIHFFIMNKAHYRNTA
jgi:hypothetical protein